MCGFDRFGGGLRRGLAAARVFLVGTDHSVFTDEAGRFRITGLDAGIYQIAYSHASTDSIGFTPEPVPIEVTIGRATAVSLEQELEQEMEDETEAAQHSYAHTRASTDRQTDALFVLFPFRC